MYLKLFSYFDSAVENSSYCLHSCLDNQLVCHCYRKSSGMYNRGFAINDSSYFVSMGQLGLNAPKL